MFSKPIVLNSYLISNFHIKNKIKILIILILVNFLGINPTDEPLVENQCLKGN